MYFGVFVICHGIQQPQEVFASLRIETVEQHRVGSAVSRGLPLQF